MKLVVFSIKAEDDLEKIGDYIAEDNPSRALSFITELRDHCNHLRQFPESHIRLPELGDNVRMMPYKNYVILYRVLEYVSIERILYGSRELFTLFTEK